MAVSGQSPNHQVPIPDTPTALFPGVSARMTPIRQTVLDILRKEDQPLRAYDLIPRLEAACGRRFQAQTIYRTLDFLLKEGLALRIESWNAYIARPEAGSDRTALFLLCDCCGAVRVVDSAMLPGVLDTLTITHGFQDVRRIVELQGTCALCHESRSSNTSPS